MKKIFLIILIVLFSLNAQALFEVKDASDHSVFEITNDGIRIFNYPDTLMIISESEIRANLDNSTKGLSRSFSLSTSATGKGALTNVLEVTTDNTIMREGVDGDQYTNFSPENIFLGLNAGEVTTGTLNLFLGNEAGKNNTSGGYNILIGDKCGLNNDTGGNNLFIGNNSGETNISSGWNLFIGHGSGNKNTAINNTFIGHNAGYTNSDGVSNLFVGTDAGAYNTGGDGNVFIGQQTGIYNTTGDNNTFLGKWAGNNNSDDSADDNTYVGYNAGSSQNLGFENTYIGSNAGESKTTGYYNTLVGFAAGQNNTTNSSNTFIGYKSGLNNIGSFNVFLGKEAGYSETGSNKLYIDNSNTTTPLIYGEFDNDFIQINGLLKVNALEIADMGDTSLGLEGDIVPYSSVGYDLGNNNATEHWDDIVGDDFINYPVVKYSKNVKAIDSSLDKIIKLKPVTFYKDRQRFGLIPEEVEKVIPEVVISQDIDIDPKTGKKIIIETEKGMNYIELIPVLIRSIQEQQEIIEQIKIDNENMRIEIKKLLNK